MTQISKTSEDIKTFFTILRGLARLANTSIYKDVTMGYTTYGTFNNSSVENSQLFKRDVKATKAAPPSSSHAGPSIWSRTKNAVNAALSHTTNENKQTAAPMDMDFEQYRIRCV